jgi:hypothetical protein
MPALKQANAIAHPDLAVSVKIICEGGRSLLPARPAACGALGIRRRDFLGAVCWAGLLRLAGLPFAPVAALVMRTGDYERLWSGCGLCTAQD